MYLIRYVMQHSLYETHYLVSGIMDRGFHFHRAVSQLLAEMALNLTDSVILPLDVVRYGLYLEGAFVNIKSRYKDKLEANAATLSNIWHVLELNNEKLA